MNILIAADGSDAALQACHLVAAFVAGRPGMQVTLLNVQRTPLRLSPEAGIHQAALDAALRDQGKRELQPAQALLAAGTSRVRIGAPSDTILETARECDADVLIMGSGRSGPLGGYALGSVALRVAPAAQCPVVLVRPGARVAGGPGEPLSVAAPVDGSKEALQAVERLAKCAPALGLMHVHLVHFQPGLTLAATLLPPHDDVLREWSSLDADSALAVSAKVLETAGIPHTLHRRTGDPATGIALFALEQGTGLIAMGTRGKGAMHHLLLGSVALRTAQTSEVPVVLMR
jgi:nucleotide-binding universal stress UspA family protein